jgi:lipopolysaccharide/colanic/teichoic acid biosynthesis glycosyltransferase
MLKKSPEGRFVKRLFDFCAASIGIVILGPLMLGIAILILLDSRGPVFYRGERVGLKGRPFRIFKFRTMVAAAESMGGPSTSDRDTRITHVGAFLRKYKLDEAPQLINIMKGEMSFVGPRPEVQKYVDMYTEEEKSILTIKPGISDWASLANPDEGSVLAKYDDPDKAYEETIRPEKLRLQLKYVRERSFLKDLKIILLTMKTIMVKKRGSEEKTISLQSENLL